MKPFERVFVTGGTGMIGASLIRRLVAEGRQVVILSRPGASRLRLADVLDRVTVVNADINDTGRLTEAFADFKPQAVFHLASTPFNPPTITLFEHLHANTIGMASLIEALKVAPDATVVYTGSAAVYGSLSKAPEQTLPQPATMLGATKAAGSALLQAHARITGQRVVELRLYTPYGPWERPTRLVPSIILSALDGKAVKTSAGLQRRDFLYIDDLLDAMITVAQTPGSGPDVFNIGSGEGIEVRTIVAQVLDLLGNPVAADYGAIPTRPDEIMEMSANIDRITTETGWRPRTPLKDGLQRMIDWTIANVDVARQLV